MSSNGRYTQSSGHDSQRPARSGNYSIPSYPSPMYAPVSANGVCEEGALARWGSPVSLSCGAEVLTSPTENRAGLSADTAQTLGTEVRPTGLSSVYMAQQRSQYAPPVSCRPGEAGPTPATPTGFPPTLPSGPSIPISTSAFKDLRSQREWEVWAPEGAAYQPLSYPQSPPPPWSYPAAALTPTTTAVAAAAYAPTVGDRGNWAMPPPMSFPAPPSEGTSMEGYSAAYHETGSGGGSRGSNGATQGCRSNPSPPVAASPWTVAVPSSTPSAPPPPGLTMGHHFVHGEAGSTNAAASNLSKENDYVMVRPEFLHMLLQQHQQLQQQKSSPSMGKNTSPYGAGMPSPYTAWGSSVGGPGDAPMAAPAAKAPFPDFLSNGGYGSAVVVGSSSNSSAVAMPPSSLVLPPWKAAGGKVPSYSSPPVPPAAEVVDAEGGNVQGEEISLEQRPAEEPLGLPGACILHPKDSKRGPRTSSSPNGSSGSGSGDADGTGSSRGDAPNSTPPPLTQEKTKQNEQRPTVFPLPLPGASMANVSAPARTGAGLLRSGPTSLRTWAAPIGAAPTPCRAGESVQRLGSVGSGGAVPPTPAVPLTLYPPFIGGAGPGMGDPFFMPGGLPHPMPSAPFPSVPPVVLPRHVSHPHVARGTAAVPGVVGQAAVAPGSTGRSTHRPPQPQLQQPQKSALGNAPSGKGAAAAESHADVKNGANFVVGGWYEGVVKRYNPLRGFGFLTCTHQLRFDFRACERACTEYADAVHEEQQKQQHQEAEEANTTAATTAKDRDGITEEKEGSAPHDPLRRSGTVPGECEALESDRAQTRTPAPSTASGRDANVRSPHHSASTHAYEEDSLLFRERGTNAAASMTLAVTEKTEGPSTADSVGTTPPLDTPTSTGKTHGTVVYSTMQWYLHMIQSAQAERSHPSAEEGRSKSSPSPTASNPKEGEESEATQERATSPGSSSSSPRPPRLSLADFGKLERESADLGDIFVHHSCISMNGFRVFVQGTIVRFSVAVLMDTVQAVDVIPLGAEWEKPLTQAAQLHPPLYKVSPTAATVLRYHHLTAERDGGSGGGGSEPQSRVGSMSVQWTDMAVIPSPAIPNSVEGQSELLIVRVPPQTGPRPPRTTVTSTWRGTTADLKTATTTLPATAGSAFGKGAAPAMASAVVVNAKTTSGAPNAELKLGSRDHADPARRAGAAVGAVSSTAGRSVGTGAPLVEVVHPDSIKATFRAMDTHHQQALQGQPGAPSITPAKSRTNSNEDNGSFDMATPSVPTTEELEGGAHGTALEKGSNTEFNEDPTVFSGGGLTSSKNDQTSGGGDTGGTGTQTSGRGSQMVTTTATVTTTTTATNPTQSSDNAESQSRNLQNSSEEQKDGNTGAGSRTTPTASSGDHEDRGSPRNIHGQQASSGRSREELAGEKAHRADHKEVAKAMAVTNTNGDAQAARQQTSSAMPTHDGTESSDMLRHANGMGGSDEEEKDAVTTTTTSTSPSGNAMPDAIPGLAPDWTEVFDFKMANERAKDILMHKTDLKFFPHHTAKRAAAAAAAAVANAAATAAMSTARGGGTAAPGLVTLAPEVVPLSAVGELDSSSSRGVEEDEDGLAASDSRSTPRHPDELGELDGYNANQSSSPLLTTADRSGRSGTTPLTENAGEHEGHALRTGREKKKPVHDGAEAAMRKRRVRERCMPPLAMVEVVHLPAELAAQIPPGIAVIALPQDTVRDLRLKAVPIVVGHDTSPASAEGAGVAASATTPGQEAVPRVHNRRTPPHASGWEDAAAVPMSPASVRSGMKLAFPTQSYADSSDSGFYRRLTAAAGDMTTSSNSGTPRSLPRRTRESGRSRKLGSAISFPSAGLMSAQAITTSSSSAAAVALRGRAARALPCGSSPAATKSRSGASNGSLTTSSSQPVPVAQSLVNIPVPPWEEESQVAWHTAQRVSGSLPSQDGHSLLSSPVPPLQGEAAVQGASRMSPQRAGAGASSSELRGDPQLPPYTSGAAAFPFLQANGAPPLLQSPVSGSVTSFRNNGNYPGLYFAPGALLYSSGDPRAAPSVWGPANPTPPAYPHVGLPASAQGGLASPPPTNPPRWTPSRDRAADPH